VAVYTVGRRRIIVLLLLTAVLLLTLDLRGNAVFDTARSGFRVALRPFETAAQVATQPVVDAWRGITRYDDLISENQRLQEQIDAQRGAEIAARNAIILNQQLLALNQLESLAQYPTVTASIIGESPSNLDQVVEIDRGSEHGIDVGMAVVNEAGLVGRVTRVFRNSSLVMLVTDPRYWVEVKVLSLEQPAAPPTTPETVPSGLDVADVTTTTTTTSTTTTVPEPTETSPDDTETELDDPDEPGDEIEPGADDDTDPDATPANTTTTLAPVLAERETGALNGQGGDRLPQVTFVSSTPILGRILEGDTVTTAGGRNSLAPPDIPVGVVANVISRPGSAGTRLEVDLSANLARLQFVRVVLYKPPAEIDG
jgi:rod shape-determining protein MreC